MVGQALDPYLRSLCMTIRNEGTGRGRGREKKQQTHWTGRSLTNFQVEKQLKAERGNAARGRKRWKGDGGVGDGTGCSSSRAPLAKFLYVLTPGVPATFTVLRRPPLLHPAQIVNIACVTPRGSVGLVTSSLGPTHTHHHQTARS